MEKRIVYKLVNSKDSSLIAYTVSDGQNLFDLSYDEVLEQMGSLTNVYMDLGEINIIGAKTVRCGAGGDFEGYKDLETWCRKNDRLDLIEQYDTESNEHAINRISYGSGDKFNWVCRKCGHKWADYLYRRRKVKQIGCPKCEKARDGYSNIDNIDSLIDWCRNNGAQELIDDIDTEKGIIEGRIHWKCHKCSYEWDTNISSRLINLSNCPKCVTIDGKGTNHGCIDGVNDLESWCRQNRDFMYLIGEYSSKNSTPINKISRSSNKKVLWGCKECGEEFVETVGNRTRNYLYGCHGCYNNYNTSYPEQIIFCWLSKYFKVINNDRKVLNGLEIDIYIPELKLAIEYDGRYWHDDEKDNGKDRAIMEKGLYFVRIREENYKDTEYTVLVAEKNDIECRGIIRKLRDYIKETFGISVSPDVDNKILKEARGRLKERVKPRIDGTGSKKRKSKTVESRAIKWDWSVR